MFNMNIRFLHVIHNSLFTLSFRTKFHVILEITDSNAITVEIMPVEGEAGSYMETGSAV